MASESRCRVCGTPIIGRRADAVFCGIGCKRRVEAARRRLLGREWSAATFRRMAANARDRQARAAYTKTAEKIEAEVAALRRLAGKGGHEDA